MYDSNISFRIRGRAIPLTIDAFSPWTQWQVDVYYFKYKIHEGTEGGKQESSILLLSLFINKNNYW